MVAKVERVHGSVETVLGVKMSYTHAMYVRPTKIVYLRKKCPCWKRNKENFRLGVVLAPDDMRNEHIIAWNRDEKSTNLRSDVVDRWGSWDVKVMDKLECSRTKTCWIEVENMVSMFLKQHGNVMCISSTSSNRLRNSKTRLNLRRRILFAR